MRQDRRNNLNGFRPHSRVDDTHTTLQAIVEAPLSSATSENLGLDNHVIAAFTRTISICELGSFDLADVPIRFATASASSGVRATSPLGTPTPY